MSAANNQSPQVHERYVVVTTTSTFRIRYAIPVEDLQRLSPDVPLSDDTLREWACDSVTCEDVEEFSQDHVGETIIDTTIENVDEILSRFDRENSYLSSWSKEKKLGFISNSAKNVVK